MTLSDDPATKAKEHAYKVFSDLTSEQKSLAVEFALGLLKDAYLAGYWQKRREFRDALKDLHHDIVYTGFSMESVKLTLEDWLEE